MAAVCRVISGGQSITLLCVKLISRGLALPCAKMINRGLALPCAKMINRDQSIALSCLVDLS